MIDDFGINSFVTHTTGLKERIQKAEKEEKNTMTKDLLAVLDISESELQIKALYELGYTEYFAKLACGRDGTTYECKTGSLADLAFRLREVDLPKMHDAMFLIQEKMGMTRYACAFWGLYHAKPIVWIIAALIAKEKDNA